MKTKIAITAAAVSPAQFTIGHVAAKVEAKLNEQTLANLSTAMHGEAFAYVKYMLFAESARKSGDPELALLLEQTAKMERFEHFADCLLYTSRCV